MPAISVLAGEVGAALDFWQAELGGHEPAPVMVRLGGPAPAKEPGIDVLLSILGGRDLRADAMRLLARTRGEPLWVIGESLAGKQGHELELCLQRLLGRGLTAPLQQVCRELVGDNYCYLQAHWEKGDRWQTSLRLAALEHLLATQEGTPSLLITLDHGTSTAYVESCAEVLVQLASVAPGLPTALILKDDLLKAYLVQARPSRTLTMLEEGLTRIPSPAPRRPVAPSSVPSLAISAEERVNRALQFLRLEVTHVSAETLTTLRTLAEEATAPVQDVTGPDRARSAAERFLYQALEACPLTRGLFELNVPLDIQFGSRRLEVDLLAKSQCIAVEVDGYYHFRDPECYRRDRRKDALLQQAGWLVLRFLAEDVVPQLETILATIYNSVICKRKEQPQDSLHESRARV